MKLVFGLGNPGPRYALNRHNVGFMFVDKYCHLKKCLQWQRNSLYSFSLCDQLSLIKPLTYMNLSGRAVKQALSDFDCTINDIIVVYDDVDLAIGRIRIRPSGSSGGHKGLQSIIDNVNTTDFIRVRIGIGPKPKNVDLVDFVLQDFEDEQLIVLDRVFDVTVNAVEMIINEGVGKAMSVFNSYEVIL
ncbi:MAG TPA: aminoacyl-tRNA hydrolase [Pseudothermotoga sp.]|uniref:aminoacyl-tRNA hydrolase n=1 Tax=Thermotoga profunda TaxID=1508420 RepID=UPI00069367CD|nr:aminoacyl-tRNA hydrolase [Thermotoga profunda]